MRNEAAPDGGCTVQRGVCLSLHELAGRGRLIEDYKHCQSFTLEPRRESVYILGGEHIPLTPGFFQGSIQGLVRVGMHR